MVAKKHVLHFEAGKEMRERIKQSVIHLGAAATDQPRRQKPF